MEVVRRAAPERDERRLILSRSCKILLKYQRSRSIIVTTGEAARNQGRKFMENPTPNYKAMRRNYLINKKLQVKYALIVGGVLALVVFLMQAHTFLVIRSVEPDQANPVLMETLRSLQLWMLSSGIIYIIVIPILSIFVSHKIAGPLYRLEKSVQEALDAEGAITPIRLRDGDELHNLAGLLNQLFERLPQNKK